MSAADGWSRSTLIDHGDIITVEPRKQFTQVRLTILEADDSLTVAYIDPADARRIAKHLRKAADLAEGNPRKPKTPKTVVDRDGDIWYRCPNGLYWCGQINAAGGSYTLAEIRETYGPTS